MRTPAEIAAAVFARMHNDRRHDREEANRSAGAWLFVRFNADEINRLWADEEAKDARAVNVMTQHDRKDSSDDTSN